jgi:CoA-disulfide reductase
MIEEWYKMSLKVVIVGGVAGGATASARLRRIDENAEIILFEKGEYISFANCGLPYYIGEVIKEKDKLVVQTPEKMKERFNIDIRIKSEVISIDKENKEVEIYDIVNNKKYKESYDKLVLSPGAEPIKPPLPGVESDKIFTLRNIPDTYRIKDYVDINRPKRAIVVGAGFIGLEVAENLHAKGVKVTVVELAEHVIGPLDYDMAAIVHQHMKAKDVEFYLKDAVKSFIDVDNCIIAELTSGRNLKADMVILGIGVRPEVRLAKEAGLKLGQLRGIEVDEYMRTSDENIYAVGDAVEINDYINGKKALIPLAGPANKQGRIAANNICGIKEKFKGTQGTSIVKIFDITVAITGNNEKALKRNEITYEKSFTHSPSHAGYYPGAIPMSIKLIFDNKTGKILGSQIIGYEGVDKRIDVIATAIRAGLTVYDLEELELAYAPPYSSAKDPVNIAGYVAANTINKSHEIFHWHDVENLDKEKDILLDVRSPLENQVGAIKNSINIELDGLRDNLDKISKDKNIYVYCQVGLRGYIAYRILKQSGFKNVKNLSGGFKTYQMATQKQSNEDIYEYDKIMKDDEIKTVDCHGEDCNVINEISVDACGLQCPGPIMKVHENIEKAQIGDVVSIKATDPAFTADIKSWCHSTGNRLLEVNTENNEITARIRKGTPSDSDLVQKKKINNDKTMVVFSGDLDKAIASFIIANGAASMGRKVTMFFTFWGLSILRKQTKSSSEKGLLDKMFGFMLPSDSKKLSLSKMNMFGAGSKMIRHVMKKKNVSSLEELIDSAIKSGVNIVACNMSMDIMGIKEDELIDGVNFGGVATFLGASEEADTTLFI